MIKKNTLFTYLIIQAHATFAQFEPPVVIEPPNPKVGDNIRIGLHTLTFPPCLILPQVNSIGQTHLFQFDNNAIDLTVVANTELFCNPIPVTPAPREFYDLGSLPEGQYTIQVSYFNSTLFPPGEAPPLPPPDNSFILAFGPEITFDVIPQAQTVDSLMPQNLFYLFISIFIVGLLFYRKTKI